MKLRMEVTKSFGSFTLSTDFTAEGERIGVFGKAARGKSTLLSFWPVC